MDIYYNPKCSTCRNTLAIMKEHGHEPNIILYLENPLGLDALKALFSMLDLESALPMVRVKDDAFKDSDLDEQSRNDDLLALIAAYPKLLQRPIVVTDKGALICRPPETVKDIL